MCKHCSVAVAIKNTISLATTYLETHATQDDLMIYSCGGVSI